MKKRSKKIIKKQPKNFSLLLKEIKTRIQQAQASAILAVNSELIRLYWDVGRTIFEKQKNEGWGSSIIPRLAKELAGELSELKGFSERNLDRMIAFYKEYPDASIISPPLVAKLGSANKQPFEAVFWAIPWTHHIMLIEKIKNLETRFWYMTQILKNGWSKNILLTMIKSKSHDRQGKAITNFQKLLPPPQSDLAQQELKDPYIFDFLTLRDTFHERELELGLLKHLEQFLLELGQGFAFVGRQYYVELNGKEFYLDLLFYHLDLRCFIAIELKKGEFKPEYAGKMNFYLSMIDETLKKKTDNPSIGLILCQEKDQIIAEYTLRGVNRPIGISEYELTRLLPKKLKSMLPTVEEIELELENSIVVETAQKITTKKKITRKNNKK